MPRQQKSSDAAAGLRPKGVYEPVAKLEPFYTGGPVRVTRDNQHMACACGDEVKVLDVASGTVAKTLPGDSEPITALVLSPDNATLVAASRSLAVKLWHWPTGECRRTWKPHRAPVADLAIDASGGYVASGSADRSIKVTDLAGGFVTHHFTGHSGIVLRVLFHPRQLMLFSSCDAGEVRVWDLVTKAPAFTMAQAHMSAVPALSLAPDGWHLLSGGRDKVVVVWDIRNGSRVATLPVYEALEGLAVLPTGSAFPGVLSVPALLQQGLSNKAHFFATAGERGIVRIWRSDTGACVYTHHSSSTSLLQQQQRGGSSKKQRKAAAAAAAGGSSESTAAAAGSELLELLLVPGGKSLLAATGDARLLFFTPLQSAGAAAADAAASSELVLSRQLIGNNDEVTDLAFLHSGDASSSSSSSSTAAAGQEGSPGGVVLGPSEPRRLAVATNSHDIRVFDLRDASCVGGCVGHRDIVLCLHTFRSSAPGAAADNDAPAAGSVELLASGSKDTEVRVWDAATFRCLAVAAGHVGAVTALAWSNSKTKGGRYLATGGADKLLKLWDTSSLLAHATAAAAAAADGDAELPSALSPPAALSTLAAVAAHDKDVNALAFSPNDSLLATASQDRTIKLWRLPSLVAVATLRGHKRGVWDLAFSPAEQVLLSCSGDKLLKMWSVTDGTCLRTLEGHTGGVLRCSFLTAGTQVLSAGADGLLKLWDARTGANVATFEGHEDRLWGLAASAGPAESLLASGGGDSRIVVWRDVTADKAAAAEAEEEGLVERQQELSNALADGDYSTAARLAFQLRHPGRLLEVLRRQPGGPPAALSALQAMMVHQLEAADLATALSYCRDWNTNSRNAHLAQVLLRALLSRHTPGQILAVPGSRELLGGLLAYSERHAARLDRLQRSTFLLDYTLAAGQVLLPADAHDAAEAAAADEAAGGSAAGGRGNGLLANGGHTQLLAMNGHHHAGDSSDSGSDEAAAGSDDDDGGDDDSSGGGGGSDGSSEQEEDASEQPSGDGAAAAAADVDNASRPGPQLPGWGGGDDLGDDWAGPEGVDDEEAAAAQEEQAGQEDKDGAMGSGSEEGGDDDMMAGGSEDGDGDAAAQDGDDSSEEQDGAAGSDEDEEKQEKQQQQQGRQLRTQRPQQVVAAAGQQQPRSSRLKQQRQQQQQDVTPAGSKRKAAAAAAAAAAPGGLRSSRKAAASPAVTRATRPRWA